MSYVSSTGLNTEEKNKKVSNVFKTKGLISSRLKALKMRKKNEERYCTVKDSLEQSLKEVQQHKAGKVQLDTWEEYLNKKNNM